MKTIVLDAMGGDFAPQAVVEGLLLALPRLVSHVILVGNEEQIVPHFHGKPIPANVEIVATTQVVEMDDKPLDAIRKKKDSSLVVGVGLIKQGRAHAFVSAGSTGACTACSQLSWRQIPGIRRPAIATNMPSHCGGFLLLDAGASPDVMPADLLEFSVMGRAYAEKVMDRPNPKVHLLNIGEEPGKGNAFAKEAFDLLKGHDWFAGNLEPKDAFKQPVDVLVCEAFAGNLVLKTAEGVAEYMASLIREQVPTNPLAKLFFLPLKKVMAPVKKQMDYAEVGGSPLLGLNGVCVICHGRSNPKAIMNALFQAETALEHDLQAGIKEGLEFLRPAVLSEPVELT